jgi:hypothetical protein
MRLLNSISRLARRPGTFRKVVFGSALDTTRVAQLAAVQGHAGTALAVFVALDDHAFYGRAGAQLDTGGPAAAGQRADEAGHAAGRDTVLRRRGAPAMREQRQHRLVRGARRQLGADQTVPAQGRLEGVVVEVLVDQVAHRQRGDAEEFEHVVAAQQAQLEPEWAKVARSRSPAARRPAAWSCSRRVRGPRRRSSACSRYAAKAALSSSDAPLEELSAHCDRRLVR